jgi:hypothetical protein
MKKYYLSDCEAATVMQILKKVQSAGQKSAVMLAALDIDKHDIKICETVLTRLKK